MIVTAEMTEYGDKISRLVVRHTPSTWWEKKVKKLKPREEFYSKLASSFCFVREDGECIYSFQRESHYEILNKAFMAGLIRRLGDDLKSIEEAKGRLEELTKTASSGGGITVPEPTTITS